jgi:hypothetical protein
MPPISGDVFCSILFLRSRHFVSRVLDRFDDVLVSGASTQIARYSPPYFLLARPRIPFQERASRHDHPRRAEPALKPVLFLKSFLQRMEFTIIGHAFDGSNLATIRLHGKYGTGLHGPAIQKHRARTAVGGVAANMRSGERQEVTDEVDQEKPRLYLCIMVPAVHFDPKMFFCGHIYFVD